MILRFFLLASVFFFASCVAIERNNPDDPGSDNYLGENRSSAYSSSLAVSSSSSVEEREHYGKNKPQFLDARDGKKYVYVKMGTKNWMAENLSYNASGSKCYNNQESNCTTYGRLYDWNTAKTACPSGWHLPTDTDWNTLVKFVNPSCSDNAHCGIAGTKLKSASGWNDFEDEENKGEIISGNGTDYYGFTALPAGGDFSSDFLFLGNYGLWWSSSEKDANEAYYRLITNGSEFVGYGNGITKSSNFFSIRCVGD